jgi:hypothetical protein
MNIFVENTEHFATVILDMKLDEIDIKFNIIYFKEIGIGQKKKFGMNLNIEDWHDLDRILGMNMLFHISSTLVPLKVDAVLHLLSFPMFLPHPQVKLFILLS